jgi:hypothetical protein
MLERLLAAVAEVELADELNLDPKVLRSLIDRLEGKFARVVRQVTERGDHLVNGHCSAVSWVMDTCTMSQNSASDRLCVGEQLQSMPKVAEALSKGQIGYQTASVICHLRDKLGEKGELLDEDEFVGYAREFSVKGMNRLSDYTR